MSNHLLAIDPILLLSEKELAHIKRTEQIDNMGEAADYIKDVLHDKFIFSDVFQTTEESHDFQVHEFLLKHKTNERKMHSMGRMNTPSDLLAFVSVSDEWLAQHKKIAEDGVHFALDDRIDPHKLHANDGATKDGRTTGFLRYDVYKTPVMMMTPEGPINYKDEKVEDMEKAADEREIHLRKRKFSMKDISKLNNAFQRAKQGSAIDAFLIGWNLIDSIQDENNQDIYSGVQQNTIPEEQPKDIHDITKSLKELELYEQNKEREMERER